MGSDMAGKTSPVPPLAPSVTDACGRILEAAAKLFSEQGYDAASMNAIAERANVSKANIYHHFRTKDELYLAVLKRACREHTHLLDDMVRNTGNPAERLRHFIAAHMQKLYAQSSVTRLILRELLENGPRRGRQLAEEVIGENFARLVGILREGQLRGELRADVDPAVVATVLVGANVFFFQSADLLRHLPDAGFAADPKRYTEMLALILLQGVLQAPVGNDATNTAATDSQGGSP